MDNLNYLDKAMDAPAAYSTKQKLLVILDEFQEIAGYSGEGFEKRIGSHIQKHT